MEARRTAEEGSGRRRWESQVGSYMVSVDGLGEVTREECT